MKLKDVKKKIREKTKSRALPIVTDRVELQKPNSKVKDLEEASEIAEKLFDTLSARGEGDVGLAAPQIGIHKKICVVRAKEPLILVNPKIIETKGETWFQEGCVSFPGISLRTKRHKDIVVKVDWVGEYTGIMIEWAKNQTLYFAADNVEIENDVGLLESVAVQHETDHVNGILFFEREWKNEPIKKEMKIGRNEKCPCGSGKKYKKCCGKI